MSYASKMAREGSEASSEVVYLTPGRGRASMSRTARGSREPGTSTKRKPMAKKKRSAAQIAATKKMQRAAKKARKSKMHGGVARAAKRSASKAKTKSPRRRARTSAAPAAAKPRKSSKRARAAKKAAKTRAANKAARSRAAKKAAKTRKHGKSHARTAHKPRKRHSTKRRGTHKRRKSGSRGRRRAVHHRRTAVATRSQVIALPGHTTKVVLAPIPSSGRRGGKKRRSSGKKRKSRKGSSRKRKTTRRREHASEAMELHGGSYGAAMENPLGAAEIIVGGLTGLIGFATSEIVDRILATHALTANGDGTFADGQGASGTDYAGLNNGTAIIAPMSLMRWAAGIGITVVPFGVAAMVRAPVGKSALQMFGFGAGIRLLGKALTDFVAQLTATTQFGQQVFINEQRAIAAQATAAGTTAPTWAAGLPSTGLGRPQLAAGTGACTAGTGACCGSCARAHAAAPASVPASTAVPPLPPAPPPATPPAPPPPVAVVMPASPPNTVPAANVPLPPVPHTRPSPPANGGSRASVLPPAPPANSGVPQAGQYGYVNGYPGVGASPAQRAGKHAWGYNPDSDQ